ncbi:hypothetical protein ABZ897_13270 [Nonomuraea sp. NPDC046802]|uniref:carbohydrate ABC transporter permease n=1 Tax=Nonomuraea sp. NPDC046802 TaxID=3154919 RepID=UPI0033FB74B1
MTATGQVLPHRRAKILPTLVLLIGAIYCLVPVAWVLVASTKSNGELFSTFTFAPGTGLLDNLRDLFSYGDGLYLRWTANSALYAGAGSAVSTLISTLAGYAMTKYDFRGRDILFYAILAGVLVPGMTLAIPQYLIMSEIDLVGGYWSFRASSRPSASTWPGYTRWRPSRTRRWRRPGSTGRASIVSSARSGCP